MKSPHYVVHDARSGQVYAQVPASPWLSAYESLERAGVQLPTTCRGSTICGLCRVEVLEGAQALPAPLADELQLLGGPDPALAPVRLACRLRLPDGLERLVLRAPLVPRRA